MRGNKEANATRARQHIALMDNLYSDLTTASSEATYEYTGVGVYDLAGVPRWKHTVYEIQNVTTEQAIENSVLEGKAAVLNFASYKNPGGGFINGMSAQEEALCHVSNLYNILKTWDALYYDWNRQHLNHALYLDRALYVPNVKFTCGKEIDVITCAAPNLSPALKYKNVYPEFIMKTQIQRVAFLCSIIKKQQVDTVILGAWGCGVFKNNPYVMAYLMTYFMKKLDGQVLKVIFAIPDAKSKPNYKAFEEALKDLDTLKINASVNEILPYLVEYEKYI